MTTIAEISEGLYRISTPIAVAPGGFSFNQYLLVDEKPLLFHTGPRGLFTATAAAIGKVMPLERLRYVAFSHSADPDSRQAACCRGPHVELPSDCRGVQYCERQYSIS